MSAGTCDSSPMAPVPPTGACFFPPYGSIENRIASHGIAWRYSIFGFGRFFVVRCVSMPFTHVQYNAGDNTHYNASIVVSPVFLLGLG